MRTNTAIVLGSFIVTNIASALVPSTPTSIKLSPIVATTTGMARPRLTVASSSNWAANVNVAIYTDSACTNNIGSVYTGQITNNVILTPNRDLAPGNYRIYARAFEILTSGASTVSASSCSRSQLSITRCPNGYTGVPKNSSIGTSRDFCVMKFEARDNAGVAVSIPGMELITNITAASAQAKCAGLGSGYYLISNAEWMTIARNIEGVTTNSSGGVFRQGNAYSGSPTSLSCLVSGRSSAEGACPSIAPETFLTNRTHVLNNGEEIWDFSGNVEEWVDWKKGPNGFDLGPQTCVLGSYELSMVPFNCRNTPLSIDPTKYRPADSALTSINGVGTFTGGPGGAMVRGGHAASSSDAGIYSASLLNLASYVNSKRGFRCVYRP